MHVKKLSEIRQGSLTCKVEESWKDQKVYRELLLVVFPKEPDKNFRASSDFI